MIVSQLPKDFAFYKKVASRQYYGAAVRLPSLPALESLLGSGSHFSADAALTGILLCILLTYTHSLTHILREATQYIMHNYTILYDTNTNAITVHCFWHASSKRSREIDA